MSQSQTPDKPASRLRGKALMPFVVLFLGGFAVYAVRKFTAMSEVSLNALVPLLGGGAMAGAVVWMVVRERRDRGNDQSGGQDGGQAGPPP